MSSVGSVFSNDLYYIKNSIIFIFCSVYDKIFIFMIKYLSTLFLVYTMKAFFYCGTLFFCCIVLIIPAFAVSIYELSVTDSINPDLSMTEYIIIHVENNSEREFTLMLPEGAYNVFVNNKNFEGLFVSDDVACDNCSVNISYYYDNIVRNFSGNYTFYRKIDFPISTNNMNYKIVLPKNHALLSNTLSMSVSPSPSNVVDDASIGSTIEWHFVYPEFPKEFAVRYAYLPPGQHAYKNKILEINLTFMFLIAVVTFLLLSFILAFIILIKKKK